MKHNRELLEQIKIVNDLLKHENLASSEKAKLEELKKSLIQAIETRNTF
jgi:hypothetical protein